MKIAFLDTQIGNVDLKTLIIFSYFIYRKKKEITFSKTKNAIYLKQKQQWKSSVF